MHAQEQTAVRFPNCCVVLDVRALDGYTRTHLEVLRRELKGVCDVYVAAHARRKGVTDPVLADMTVEVDDRDVFAGIPHAKDVSRGLVPGNCDLKFLAVARALPPHYRQIVWWEYDVVCTVPAGEAVTRLLDATVGCDFAASYLSDNGDDGWLWWESLHAPHPVAPRRAFMPLLVASRAFALGYEGLLAAGWRGHSEVLMPTAARHLGLTSADIGGPALGLTRWPHFRALAAGSASGEPPIFLHPVKGFSQLSRHDLPRSGLAEAARRLRRGTGGLIEAPPVPRRR